MDGFLRIAIFLFLFSAFPAKASKKFGPFDTKTYLISNCLRVKSDEEFKSTWKFKVTKLSRTKEDIQGFVYLPKNISVVSASAIGEEYVNGGFKPFFKINTKNPCKYSFFGKILLNVVEMDVKTCWIKTGNYTVQNISADQVMHWFTSGNFYARMRFEVSFETTKGSVFCMRIDLECKPLN